MLSNGRGFQISSSRGGGPSPAPTAAPPSFPGHTSKNCSRPAGTSISATAPCWARCTTAACR